jgi:hypothetical protein
MTERWRGNAVAGCDDGVAWAAEPQTVVTAVTAASAAQPVLRVLAVTHNTFQEDSRRDGPI